MRATADRCDTLVLGAGAAGLSAAAHLATAGRDVLVLEARGRLGGRIWPRRLGRSRLAAELGAELMHGRAPLTSAWLARVGAAPVDVPSSHWMRRGGRFVEAGDLFPRLSAALARSPLLRGRDRSFAELLERTAALRGPVRRFARMLVEGFDAAEPALASAQAIAEEWRGSGAANAPTFRPLGGHAPLLAALERAAREGGARILRRCVARGLRWRRGAVECSGHGASGPFVVRARRAVVTLPLGVLQRAADAPGALRFDPPLPEKDRALRQLHSGHVLKVVLQFDAAFWEEIDRGRLADGTFFHSPGATFPTLWTALPVRAPQLVAWAGGPRTASLRGGEPARVLRAAVESVAQAFGPRARVARRLRAAAFHDWSADPFARGAYSYVGVGGAGARRQLARAVAGTLFFAGEATSEESAGTVEGALESGVRVAREVAGGGGTALAPPAAAARPAGAREEPDMPSRKTVKAARRDRRQGKSPSTQAGEFVREEIEDIRSGKHGARSSKQAIAIGLSKARRAGVDLPPPRKGTVSEKTRRSAERDSRAGRGAGRRRVSRKRSAASTRALRREGRSAASRRALSRQARSAAARRSPAQRRASARRAARTRSR